MTALSLTRAERLGDADEHQDNRVGLSRSSRSLDPARLRAFAS